MILNIVTNDPQYVLKKLQVTLTKCWDVEYYRSVADDIHEYKLIPAVDDVCLNVETLLETGIRPWDIRICEYKPSDEQ